MTLAGPNLPGGQTQDQADDGRLAGYVDAIVSGRVFGWAWDASRPERSVTIEVGEGDRIIGSAEANRFREDLKNLGLGDGRHAFEFELPEGLRDTPARNLRVSFQDSGEELPRNIQLALVSDEGGDAGDDAGRMRRIEESLAKMVNVTVSMHGQLVEQRGMIDALRKQAPAGNIERRLDASFSALNRRLDELSKTLAGAETFLLRTDEKLRALSEPPDRRDADAALHREIRGMGLILLCAIIAVMAMLLN